MACDITINAGRTLSCKNAVGGLKNVYFINFSSDTFVYSASTETVSGPISAGTPAYKYELHLGNDLTQNIQSSAENGTLYFEQNLNLTLKKLSAADNVQIKRLASGHPHILVEDQMENVWVVGRLNGSDVVAGTAVSGNAFGDLNGYTLQFQALESTLANDYTGDVASDFTVVTG